MKKIVIPILFLFALSSWSQSFEEQFSTANGLYKDGDFNKAVELYLSIENEGVESADLYFNLGNCYYKMNKVAPYISMGRYIYASGSQASLPPRGAG